MTYLFQAASLAYYLLYFQSQSPSNIGFSLNMVCASAPCTGTELTLLSGYRVFEHDPVVGSHTQRFRS
jgi:hypothetical protein